MSSNASEKKNGPYSEYMRYHPDRWAAISALRCNTGMSFSEANRVIDQLFDTSAADEVRAADAEQEEIYQAQLAEEAQLKRGTGLFTALGAIFNRGEK